VRLFVADAFVENPINRDLGSIKLTFPPDLEIPAPKKAFGQARCVAIVVGSITHGALSHL
jgi:hypothetical protein